MTHTDRRADDIIKTHQQHGFLRYFLSLSTTFIICVVTTTRHTVIFGVMWSFFSFYPEEKLLHCTLDERVLPIIVYAIHQEDCTFLFAYQRLLTMITSISH